MNEITKKINHIVIVGGGTAGWMTAAALSHHFDHAQVKITLIDSSKIGTVGVGEATIPTLRRFYQKLGFTDQYVMKRTKATCKLGIEFKDWRCLGDTFIHPFGLFGQNVNNVPFHHYWLKLKQQGDKTDFSQYSLAVQLAKNNKFFLPYAKPNNQLEVFDWALHFDASLFATLMKTYSVEHQVNHIDSEIGHVAMNEHSGDIESLSLKNGQCISGDLFIDCSGFDALLIEKTLATGYHDWSEWLLCDRAVAVQSESVDEPAPRTIVTAHEAGWQWKIPLQHRQGNGHVYSSRFTDEQTAKTRLLENIDGKLIADPRTFSFTPGRRNRAWNKNCIAVGLAAGFLEPLESTSIALVETAIDKIVQSLAQLSYDKKIVEHFNQVTKLEYECVRDFIILHYKANQRNDSLMWRYCQNMSVPNSLQTRMDTFKSSGKLARCAWDMFGADSWLAVYHGLNFIPQTYSTQIDSTPLDLVKNGLLNMKRDIAKYTANAPAHHHFLAQHFNYQTDKQTNRSKICE